MTSDFGRLGESLDRDGYALRRGVISKETIAVLLNALLVAENGSVNRRSLLRDCRATAELAASPPLRTIADDALHSAAFAVRALLFDKVSGRNWGVPWHQDLAIAVSEKHEVPGFGGWSVKDGIPHVLPPTKVLEAMITLRLHLDDCDAENGPLRVLSGSHRAGRLTDADIACWRARVPEFVCAAPRGSVLAMRPLLLHASSAARQPGHRRVLHIEYAAQPLPGGLRWAAQPS